MVDGRYTDPLVIAFKDILVKSRIVFSGVIPSFGNTHFLLASLKRQQSETKDDKKLRILHKIKPHQRGICW